MAAQASTTTQAAAEGKGKSKAENPPEEVSMDEDDNSSEEESGIEEEACNLLMQLLVFPSSKFLCIFLANGFTSVGSRRTYVDSLTVTYPINLTN